MYLRRRRWRRGIWEIYWNNAHLLVWLVLLGPTLLFRAAHKEFAGNKEIKLSLPCGYHHHHHHLFLVVLGILSWKGPVIYLWPILRVVVVPFGQFLVIALLCFPSTKALKELHSLSVWLFAPPPIQWWCWLDHNKSLRVSCYELDRPTNNGGKWEREGEMQRYIIGLLNRIGYLIRQWLGGWWRLKVKRQQHGKMAVGCDFDSIRLIYLQIRQTHRRRWSSSDELAHLRM